MSAEKTKKPKKPETKASLKKKLRVVLHKYIRMRDAYCEDGAWWVKCVTCGERIPFKDSTAGHFFPAGTYPAVRFAEWNINGQCIRCNKYQHRSLDPVHHRNDRRYGIKGLDDFYQAATSRKQDLTCAELQDLIEMYKAKLECTQRSKPIMPENG